MDTAADSLRQDLGAEHQAIVKVVGEFDGRLMIVKGWSVTLSLAGLGLGFQQGHYALFALAAGTALAFWYIEALMKRHQMRYYPRMREIEVAAYHLNHQDLDGVSVSSPQVDWSWTEAGRGVPQPYAPAEVRRMLSIAPWLPHVFLPHAVAVLLGAVLYFCALADLPGLAQLKP
ncbi:hypothetical protein [Actinoplanes friuliensis]|uniref:Uncharacterized protein n=1 Tax=Actinoplanes friuliensis DSM 7358 TaxID=1246995 RepID=U5VUE5_9ACTN|nr:hypothetical protein [Actinoplanes friuliensis]AGZ40573.1 hypothetical protein AFR_11420 [Actinoplanes friuliensis DSM 7358]